jgi:hypothetical protein
MAMDSEIALIGFASNGTKNPDALVVVNIGKAKKVNLRVKGTSAKTFAAFRTTVAPKENYASLGSFAVRTGAIAYEAPGGSVTTFFAE